jgi:hypothetical protein
MTARSTNRTREILRKVLKAVLKKVLGDDLGSMAFEQFKGVGPSALLATLLLFSITASIYWLPSLYQKAVELSSLFPGEVTVKFLDPVPRFQGTKDPVSLRVQLVDKSNVTFPIAANQVGIFQEPSEELYFDHSNLHVDSEEFTATSLAPTEYQVFAKFNGTSKFKPAKSKELRFVLVDKPDVAEQKAWNPIFRDSIDGPYRQKWFAVHPKLGQNVSQVLQITAQRDTELKDTPFIWYQHQVGLPCEIGFTMRPVEAGAQLAISLGDQLVFVIDTEAQFRLSAWERDLSSTDPPKRIQLGSGGQQVDSVLLPIDVRSAENRYTQVQFRLSSKDPARYILAVTLHGVAPGKDATTEISFALSTPLPKMGLVGLGSSRMSNGVEIGDLYLYAVREH